MKIRKEHWIDKEDVVLGISFSFGRNGYSDRFSFHLGFATIYSDAPYRGCFMACDRPSSMINWLILLNGGVWCWEKAWFPNLEGLYHFAWMCRTWGLMDIPESFLQGLLSEWQSKYDAGSLDEIPF